MDPHPNNERAMRAFAAIKVATDFPHNDPYTDLSDLLANLHHFADRHQITWSAVLDKAENAYAGDHEDGPPASPVCTPESYETKAPSLDPLAQRAVNSILEHGLSAPELNEAIDRAVAWIEQHPHATRYTTDNDERTTR